MTSGTFKIRGRARDVAEFRRLLSPLTGTYHWTLTQAGRPLRRNEIALPLPALTVAARRFMQYSGMKPTHLLVRMVALVLLLAPAAFGSDLADASARARAAGRAGSFSAMETTAAAAPFYFSLPSGPDLYPAYTNEQATPRHGADWWPVADGRTWNGLVAAPTHPYPGPLDPWAYYGPSWPRTSHPGPSRPPAIGSPRPSPSGHLAPSRSSGGGRKR